MKYERLYIDEIDDALMLATHAEKYRIEYNTIRPHEALVWNRPLDVHLGLADPYDPHLSNREIPATFFTRDIGTSRDSLFSTRSAAATGGADVKQSGRP